ncbi:MAG: MFS transporter [Novosphingobium sp.]|nr:MFS transporter [Novosphingobium sp.]MBO9601589.1 MFS transporter [Novosphingobium sp.]
MNGTENAASGAGGTVQTTRSSPRGYEARMVLITSLVVSTVAADRYATGYLGPYLVEAFNISKAQLGAVYSIQAVAVAVAGYAMGFLSDRLGRQIAILVPLMLLAAMAAIGVLPVQAYLTLLLVRAASGCALGGIVPVTQAVTTSQSKPSKVGRNIAIQTLFLFFISQMLAPIVQTRVADHWGWQAGYAISALPFVVLAVLLGLFVKDSGKARPTVDSPEPASTAMSPEARRTVLLCLVISAGFTFWAIIHSTFLALYLVERLGYTPVAAGNTLGMLGVAGAVGGIGLPLLSDYIGRRGALILGMLLAASLPVTLLMWSGPAWGFNILLFVGWIAMGSLPIHAVLVPSDVVPAARVASTVALILAVGEILGGVVGPIAGGALADRFGAQTPFQVAFGTALLSLVCALLLPRPRKA